MHLVIHTEEELLLLRQIGFCNGCIEKRIWYLEALLSEKELILFRNGKKHYIILMSYANIVLWCSHWKFHCYEAASKYTCTMVRNTPVFFMNSFLCFSQLCRSLFSDFLDFDHLLLLVSANIITKRISQGRAHPCHFKKIIKGSLGWKKA